MAASRPRSRSPKRGRDYCSAIRRDGADTIFLGSFLTLEDDLPTAKAVAVRDGVVVALGTSAAEVQDHWQSPTTELVDLSDAGCIVPGFVESHAHPLIAAQFSERVDCSPDSVSSLAEVQTRLASRASQMSPGHWVRGWGLEPCLLCEFVEDRRLSLLRKGDLDRGFPTGGGHKLSVSSLSGHLMFVNSTALARAGITKDTPDPEGGTYVRDEVTAEPTGELKQGPSFLPIIQAIAEDEGPATSGVEVEAAALAERLIDVVRAFSRQGVTSVHDLGLGVFDYITAPTSVRAYQLALTRPVEELPIRVLAYTHWDAISRGYRPPYVGPFPAAGARLAFGGVKLHADGSLQGGTGYLMSPYYGQAKHRGMLLQTAEVLKARVMDLHEAGMQLAIHANGDAAIELVIDALEEALRRHPREDHRHRIEHCQTATRCQLQRMAKLGIAASFFLNHVHLYGDAHRERFLGPERAANISPLKWAQECGVRFGLHADTPVTPSRPLRSIWSAVTRKTRSGKVLGPEQRIGVMAALRAYTIDNAWLGGEEKVKGSLAVGKLADMALLSANPLDVDSDHIRSISVLGIIVGGCLVRNQPLPP